MKHLLTIALLFFISYSVAQNLEVIKKGTTTLPKRKLKEEFTLLENGIDTASLTFVGTFKVSGPINKLTLIDHFFLIKETARKLGANAYFLDHHESDTVNNIATTTMSTFFASPAVKSKNEGLKTTNTIYIFGDDRIYLKNRSTPFSFNGQLKEVQNTAEFFSYTYKEGEHIKISKGRSLGSSLQFIGERGTPAIYLKIGGANVAIQPVVNGAIAQAGNISPMDKSLGEFLIHVLNPIL